jgi:putative nucleotidyltransferase with HDIG domain
MMMIRDTIATMLSEKIGALPGMEQTLRKLSDIVANPDSTAGNVAEAVRFDPALAAKVLRLANSAYVGLPRAIDSIKSAVVLLGQKRVYSVALTAGVLKAMNIKDGTPLSQLDFWRHSVAVGMIAESISKSVRRQGAVDSDGAFTAGLLHDIGKLALASFLPGPFRESAERCIENGIPFFQAEQGEMSHVVAGRLLAEKWNFPEDLSNAIAWHHKPLKNAAGKRIVSIVHLADAVAHLMDVPAIRGEAPPQLDTGAIAMVNIQPERLRTIATEALSNEKKIESLIECIA